MVAGAVVALVLVLLGGSAVTWWLAHDPGESRLAELPRVTDDKAGISYALPEGWEHSEGEELISAFSSMINAGRLEKGVDEEVRASVLAGPTGGIPESDLRRETEQAATSNTVYFFPDGSSSLQDSHPTTISDRPAHTVVLRFEDGNGQTGHLRMTVVSVDDQRSAFLLGIALSDGPAARERVDGVLASAKLI